MPINLFWFHLCKKVQVWNLKVLLDRSQAWMTTHLSQIPTTTATTVPQLGNAVNMALHFILQHMDLQ